MMDGSFRLRAAPLPEAGFPPASRALHHPCATMPSSTTLRPSTASFPSYPLSTIPYPLTTHPPIPTHTSSPYFALSRSQIAPLLPLSLAQRSQGRSRFRSLKVRPTHCRFLVGEVSAEEMAVQGFVEVEIVCPQPPRREVWWHILGGFEVSFGVAWCRSWQMAGSSQWMEVGSDLPRDSSGVAGRLDCCRRQPKGLQLGGYLANLGFVGASRSFREAFLWSKQDL